MARIGVVGWRRGASDALQSALSKTINELGYQPVPFDYDARLPVDLDVVFAFGPYGTLKEVVRQIRQAPSRPPAFAFWLIESLPNPSLSKWLWDLAGAVHSGVNRAMLKKDRLGGWHRYLKLKWLMSKARRFGHYGELQWLRHQGVLSVLAVGSDWNARLLRQNGFDPLVAYIGYHSDWAVNEEPERDIPVLWIGWPGTNRRRKILHHIRKELRNRNIEMVMIDGVENPFCTGKTRGNLLKRSKIVLNLLKREWDSNSFRFFLAAANRCLMISEPMLPHCPLKPGVHLVETPVKQIVNSICYFLNHTEERDKIAKQGYELVTTKLTLKSAVHKILERSFRQNE